jgi:ABC-type dipeptide/oligopeptide/nickel transport system permease component
MSSLVTVLVMTLLIFLLIRMTGDPTHVMLPPEATEADREILRQQLGLNQPLLVQYAIYIGNIVRGDFGMSLYYGIPVVDILRAALGPSFLLAGSALALALMAGIPLGILAAAYPKSLVKRLSMMVSIIGQAAPSFLIGLLLIRLFGVEFGWVPTSGYGDFTHLILPAISLSLFTTAGIIRLTESNMTEVLTSDYIRLARIKGLPTRVVLLRHAFRNAAKPIVTFAALQFGTLMGSAVTIETVFSWPGLGKTMVDAIQQIDFNLVQAGAIVLVVIFVTLNFLADILYGLVDPRISYDS